MTQTPQEQPLVFVVDDDPSIRRALDSLLRSVEVQVQTFASIEEFRQRELPNAPACLVLDVRLRGQGGLEFQRDLMTSDTPLPIIFITGHGDIPMSVRAMKAGAIEFLTKPFRDRDLLDAIQLALETDRARRSESASLAELQKRFDGLTTREREVMELATAGMLNKQIAAALDVSEITVKVCRGRLMRKMHAASFAELVRMADRLGASPPRS